MGTAERKIMDVLSGKTVSPPPIWLMRQAGRYLPEYRQVRATAKGFLDLCYTPDLATEVTLQPIRRFGFDAAILFSDILVIPDAMNRNVRFREGEGPLLDPIDVDGIETLTMPDVNTFLAPVFETVGRLRRELPRQTTLLGFWIRAVRWGSLIGTPRPIPSASLFGATMIGFMANNILPLRLGEFIRPWALARRERLSKTTLFATVVVERAIDMVTLLVIFGLSLLVHPISGETEASVPVFLPFGRVSSTGMPMPSSSAKDSGTSISTSRRDRSTTTISGASRAIIARSTTLIVPTMPSTGARTVSSS